MLKEEDLTLVGRASSSPPAMALTSLAPSAEAAAVAARISTTGWHLALMICDLMAAVGALLMAIVGRFGVTAPLGPTAPYVVWLFIGPFAWIGLLILTGAYDDDRLGAGAAEFGKVVNASLWMLSGVIGVSYLAHAELSREVVAISMVGTLLMSLAAHLVGRRLLHRRLRIGAAIHHVVAVGADHEVAGLVEHISRLPHSGLRVVGQCLVGQGLQHSVRPSSLTFVSDIVQVARGLKADTIAIAGSGTLSGKELRRLSWDLEGTGIRLLVAPSITELAGPRLLIQPVGGLPLLHIRETVFSGPNRVLKATLDRALAATLCVFLLPAFAAIAAAVRLSGRGPILFRQSRIGLYGREFTVLKFRTMHQHAESLQTRLMDLNETDGVLFKIRRDPRITRVGRFLRRYSLDELPQIWNVLTGTMSLVGPRPPLGSEVERYPEDLRRRRLLVKPGITGLWQVSGRADLSWEESVRLDLQYVDNWSVLLDLAIIWKTFTAVASGRGAY